MSMHPIFARPHVRRWLARNQPYSIGDFCVFLLAVVILFLVIL